MATVNCKTNNIPFFATPGKENLGVSLPTKLKKTFLKNLWKHRFFFKRKQSRNYLP